MHRLRTNRGSSCGYASLAVVNRQADCKSTVFESKSDKVKDGIGCPQWRLQSELCNKKWASCYAGGMTRKERQSLTSQ